MPLFTWTSKTNFSRTCSWSNMTKEIFSIFPSCSWRFILPSSCRMYWFTPGWHATWNEFVLNMLHHLQAKTTPEEIWHQELVQGIYEFYISKLEREQHFFCRQFARDTNLNWNVVLPSPLKHLTWVELSDVQNRMECDLQKFARHVSRNWNWRVQLQHEGVSPLMFLSDMKTMLFFNIHCHFHVQKDKNRTEFGLDSTIPGLFGAVDLRANNAKLLSEPIL